MRTTCPYCGVGCGVLAMVAEDGSVAVRGDPEHPANRGRLCSKGANLPDTLGLGERLLHPTINGRRVGWEEAIAAVAGRLSDTIRRHGPDSVAFYVSGQLLTEDYYVANKLVKGFLGTANIDTNSRLCMASSVAGHKRGFGADAVPVTYEDVELADLIVLVGSNLAWCHPILHQRVLAGKKARGTRIVVVDPRRTAAVDGADRHLALKPGTDATLFNGLLVHLADTGTLDARFVAEHTSGLKDALDAARADAPSPEHVAAVCGLSVEEVAAFYAEFATTSRVVTVYSQGVNQSSQGTDTVNTILNAHFLTGRIGAPGMGPFSVTGQPNAMGGREVGGLANQLAAHMGFEPESVDRVRRFWNAPNMAAKPGLKAVDLFRAVEDGTVHAVWVMATNPAVSMPDAARVRRALAKCETVIVSDCIADTDTGRLAHIRLPAAGWSEKDGTVTNSDRTISRQRPFRPFSGEAKPDWWIMTQVARAMGFGDAFPYETPADVFREHAALSGFENDGSRAFDIGGLAGISDAEFETLSPAPWPRRVGSEPTRRLYTDGRFFTADGRARFVPVTTRALPRAVAPGSLILNTGRSRDQWHTMTRTGLSPRLSSNAPEPVLDVHPRDAEARGLTDGGLARATTPVGTALARVRVTEAQRPGEAFLPMHWTDRFTGSCVIGRLIDDNAVDPFSGQPDLKRMPVTVEPYITAGATAWTGFLIARQPVEPTHGGYWARRAVPGGHLIELAGDGALPSPDEFTFDLKGATVDYSDGARGVLRRAWLTHDRLEACLFLSASGGLPGRGWLVDLLSAEAMDAPARRALLSGRSPVPVLDEGRTVCSCFGVGITRIIAALQSQRLTTVQEVGQALKAGTNCGSCIPEIKEIIADAQRCHVA
ncbi:molybdopterin-dependent oxidoreductase [Azospirillum canadense]|uniref:molybdopterin-dependent oxidoreductase n=1 Tax=Azospirillum canadense TaxID=403962 RepID=UPI0029CAB933|nr:molybdopterin-dependent oxidoreductase [Azospirillum canadense]MCW2244213.1 assimilatory nitrate reductase catalytic subunit [Azospirillum canadense]